MTIEFVPGKGWVTEGGSNVSAGSQDINNAQQAHGAKQGNRRSMYGNYDQYLDQDNLSWLKDSIGDSWWWSVGRLGNLSSDQDRFWKEFATTSDEQYNNSAEIVNRYQALIESGMDPADVQNAIWGDANLSPSTQNTGGGVTGPGMLPAIGAGDGADDLSNPAGDQKQSSAASMLRNGLNPDHVARGPRTGVWGAGHGAGGYGPAAEQQGMMGSDANNMRQAIVTALEKKLLG